VRRPWLSGALGVIAAVAVFATPALWEFLHCGSLNNIAGADFWWHLQTGLEILRTHSLPHSGWFSQSSTLPWIASSWLYDVRIAAWYQMLGLRSLPVLALAAKFFLAVLTFLLARGIRGRFWTALALSAIAQYLLWSMSPLPVFCSVLALAIELTLIFEFRNRGSSWALYSLPALFLVWANLDSHFVYGLLVLLLFALANLAGQWGRAQGITWLASDPIGDQTKTVLAIAATCVIAGCITPYGWNSYAVFWANATSAANAHFPDYLSLRFRTPQDYVLMLLTMAAFLALGMRRSRDLFQIGLLVLCTVAAFHSQRDAWLLVLAAVAVIADTVPKEVASGERQATSVKPRTTFLLATAISFVLLLVFCLVRLPQRDAVLAKIAETYPVAAADYIRANHLPEPLFNSFYWGGFLTWYLPQYPVAIDGRTDLYGPDFNIQYADVMSARAHYSTFPPLSNAATILVEKNSLAGKALPNVRGFKTAYSDNLAVVLVREREQDQP
jgi:hypothetical protein